MAEEGCWARRIPGDAAHTPHTCTRKHTRVHAPCTYHITRAHTQKSTTHTHISSRFTKHCSTVSGKETPAQEMRDNL